MYTNKPKGYTYSDFIHQFSQAKTDANTFISGLADSTFLMRPAPDTWSIAECFNHLTIFGSIYLNTIQSAYQDADIAAHSLKEVTFAPRFYWKWIIDWFEPPYTIKVKTFRPFEPEAAKGFTRQQVLHDFLELQDLYITSLQEKEKNKVSLGAIMAGNPIFPFIKMKLSECYAVVGAHQRRHFWQAEQISKKIPAS